MRLFVAVEISGQARQAAADVAGRLRRGLGRAVSARWIEPANMHLTVRFIGHVADERVPRVVEALQPPVSVAPFAVALGSCGVFPRSGGPRVIWIGLRHGLEPLAAMHDEFNRRLRPLGFEPEDRRFSAHLTLARVKEAHASVRQVITETPVPPAAWQVAAATVFQSLVSSRGARYEPLIRVACQSKTPTAT